LWVGTQRALISDFQDLDAIGARLAGAADTFIEPDAIADKRLKFPDHLRDVKK
jgi:hypothetical protein